MKKISKQELKEASKGVGISDEQLDQLWQNLNIEVSRSLAGSVSFYSGLAVILLAMLWLMNATWQLYGGKLLLIISLIYFIFFLLSGSYFYRHNASVKLSGVLTTLAVFMLVPIVYSLQLMFNMWPLGEPDTQQEFFLSTEGHWLPEQLALLVGATVALRHYGLPLLMFPLILSIWWIVIDLAPLFPQSVEWISLYFGLVLTIASLILDLKKRENFAFWGYLFGLLSFWTSLSVLSETEWQLVGYCAVNLLLITLGIILGRKIFLVFGFLGVTYYLFHLAYYLFENSILFPLILSLMGLIVIATGYYLTRRMQRF